MPCLNNIGKGSNTENKDILRDSDAEVEEMLSCKEGYGVFTDIPL